MIFTLSKKVISPFSPKDLLKIVKPSIYQILIQNCIKYKHSLVDKLVFLCTVEVSTRKR